MHYCSLQDGSWPERERQLIMLRIDRKVCRKMLNIAQFPCHLDLHFVAFEPPAYPTKYSVLQVY